MTEQKIDLPEVKDNFDELEKAAKKFSQTILTYIAARTQRDELDLINRGPQQAPNLAVLGTDQLQLLLTLNQNSLQLLSGVQTYKQAFLQSNVIAMR